MEPINYDNSVGVSAPQGGGMLAGGKWKWYALGAVLGIALLMYVRSKNAAAASGAASSGNAAPNPTGTVSGTGMDTGAQSSLQGINDQLGQLLQNQQNGTPTTNTQAGAAPVYTDLSHALANSGGYVPGSGYVGGNIVTKQGSFIGVANSQILNTLQQAGSPIYALTSPGGDTPFTQVDPNKLSPGTNIYQKVG